ncbi:hypothetical protein LTR70_003912 [Exophiala xenobiotica]|uniref:JmjC domain-containing protein n=1 Tax=Lithohypha guttulata TaxID=1690604 RepID=A0ABR0KES4_9EURO|nr:hypothetical protein LTR24_003398 [Lithohypha guttulata]KAK5322231.1 hypothetical protein LTR70_003912 [Exophiala xenobiotica]
MPSTRPCAAFEPISPDFDLKTLVESTPSFEYAVRIHSDMIEHHGLASFERLVLMHVILGGKPLVIEGYESRLDRWIFAIQWLRDNCGSNVVDARDLTKQINVPMSIGHYLKHMSLLTNQWTPHNYKDPERQRMYLKDIDCPPMWQERTAEHIPPVLFYLNESTGEFGGLGAIEEPDPSGNGTRRGRGIAKAGDLMSSLPKEMRAENLQCYIGHEGTYTPAHREMCASLGQNLMVEASTGTTEDGKPSNPGSSIWFMTETKEREVVSEYWLSRLGHDIEVEKHFAQVNAWKNAPFKTYVVDQKPGDFILIPPLAPHQVWNRGTRTMKVAWNRTTVETLEMAMNEALFKARMVCRDEQYKNKAIIYYTLQKYSKLLQQADKHKQKNPESKKLKRADTQLRQLQKDFNRLHALFTRILVDESFYPDRVEKKVEMVTFDSNVTCSYCRCNIFNRFLTCPSCVGDLPNGEQDTYDVCLDCYAMGRSCACISKLKWVEQWNWGELVQKHEQWRHLIIQNEGQVTDKTPKSLKHELERRDKRRTTAQICQTELLKRPWRDIRKPAPAPEPEVEEDVQVDEYGNVKKKKVKKKSEKFMRDHARCHVDCYWEPQWKQAHCTKCQKNYCYGLLFRAYDMMPQDILADPEWKCPSCRNICGCRHCRKKPGFKRYTPKGTLLGHNTKAVADPRSVESLVDFSASNIQWIQKADDDYDAQDTRRLQRRRREANAAMNKDPELGDDYVNEDEAQDIEGGIIRLAEQEGIPIDPALGSGWTAVNNATNAESQDEDEINENPEEVSERIGVVEEVDHEPQYALPERGIIQDPQHAYDYTDMITFTYPDPVMGQVPPMPVEGYQQAADELPYQEAEPLSPSKIEMVERKRKRKVDEGDQPFQYKQQSKKKSSSKKQRQSLVVRLAISKDKLQEMDKMASIARSALSGAVAPAPVVSSDLQALNVYPSEDGQPPAKKIRREERLPPLDVDTEYAPSRSRDRRKVPVDGTVLPPPDANIERRATRLHNVTYAEPDENDFNEIVVPKSKLATMEGANVRDSIEIDDNDQERQSEEEVDEERDSTPQAQGAGKRPALTTSAAVARLGNGVRSSPQLSSLRKSLPATPSPNAGRPSTASSAVQQQSAAVSKAALEAQANANRRAKMAAIDMDIDDIDDIEDDSTDESDHTPELSNAPASSAVTQPLPKSATPQPPPGVPATNGRIATSTTVANRGSSMKANGNSMGKLPATSMRSGQNVVPTTAAVKAASAQKVSAADWGDSDSDSD